MRHVAPYVFIVLALCLLAAPGAAAAQEYPARNVYTPIQAAPAAQAAPYGMQAATGQGYAGQGLPGQAYAPAMQDFAAGPYVQNFDAGTIDWTTGRVTAVGIGAPPANALNPAQARAMAIRAATVIARRNLLEIIQGVALDSRTTVRNYMVSDETVVSEVRGYLQNSSILDTAYMSDGSIEVTVGINLRGAFADALLPKTMPFRAPGTLPQAAPAPAPALQAPTQVSPPVRNPLEGPTPGEGADLGAPQVPDAPVPAPAVSMADYSGVVIDARGLKVRPAMSPKILAESGEQVYGSASVSRQYAIEQGIAGYARGLDAALQNPRVAGNPLVLKAVSAAGPAGADLVIPGPQAELLKAMAGAGVLEKCRVMIVLD